MLIWIVCVHESIHGFVWVWMHLCMYIIKFIHYMSMCIYIYIYIHTYISLHICVEYSDNHWSSHRSLAPFPHPSATFANAIPFIVTQRQCNSPWTLWPCKTWNKRLGWGPPSSRQRRGVWFVEFVAVFCCKMFGANGFFEVVSMIPELLSLFW